jgi:steroid 5-alpha reductase family enzyme
MQGLFSMVNNASAIYIMRYSEAGKTLSNVDMAGIAVWLIGFSMEVIADAELSAHRNNPAKQGTIIMTGTWRYSRHPNYFGESLMWWGIYIISLSVPGANVTIFSAIFITLLVRFVSGVPFPEKKYAENPEWQKVCEETNVFVPWFSGMDREE